MVDFFINIKDQIGFYFFILKFFLYFIIGAIFLLLIRKIFKLFQLINKRFKKEFFLENLKVFINIILFIIISILIGWIIIMLITKKIF